MNTLVIYDNTGKIFVQITGGYTVPQGGVQYLECEMLQGKIVDSINVSSTPHIPVFADIPKSDIEQLKEQNAAMLLALVEAGLM
jgi:hypothetical protein